MYHGLGVFIEEIRVEGNKWRKRILYLFKACLHHNTIQYMGQRCNYHITEKSDATDLANYRDCSHTCINSLRK